jgi:hypothetical protein
MTLEGQFWFPIRREYLLMLGQYISSKHELHPIASILEAQLYAYVGPYKRKGLFNRINLDEIIH